MSQCLSVVGSQDDKGKLALLLLCWMTLFIYFKFGDSVQDPVPNVWEIVFSNVSNEAGVVHPYVHGFLYGPGQAVFFSAYEYMYMSMHACIYLWWQTCRILCMYLCECIVLDRHRHIDLIDRQIDRKTYIHACIIIHMPTYIHVCLQKYILMLIHVYVHTHMHIYVTGIEIGIWNSCSSSCMAGKGKEVGDISRCTGELAWLYCTCTKAFPT